MRAALFLIIALWDPLAVAQTENDPVVTKVVRVKGNADVLAQMVRSVTNSHIDGNNGLKAVIINAKASEVSRLERSILDLDTGSSEVNSANDIEVTAYVLAGLRQAETGVSEVPSEALTSVIRQLRSTFPFKQYLTLGTFVVHSAPHSLSKVSGTLKPVREEDAHGPMPVEIFFNAAAVQENNTVHLQDFAFSAKLPFITPRPPKTPAPAGIFATTQVQNAPVELRANINLRENQKVVVAQSSIGYEGDSLFLVLSAHIVR